MSYMKSTSADKRKGKFIAKINMPPAVSKADEYIATEWRMKI